MTRSGLGRPPPGGSLFAFAVLVAALLGFLIVSADEHQLDQNQPAVLSQEDFRENVSGLSSATDVVFVLLPAVTAAAVPPAGQEDAFADSFSTTDVQRAALLMQSIEHEYGGDRSARVGAVLISKAGTAFVLQSLQEVADSSFIEKIQTVAAAERRPLNDANNAQKGQGGGEDSCSTNTAADHNAQWAQAAKYLRGVEAVFASALRESTGSKRYGEPRLNTSSSSSTTMEFHGNELHALGVAGDGGNDNDPTTNVGWRRLRDAHRHIIVLQYDAADEGSHRVECRAQPAAAAAAAATEQQRASSSSFFPGLLEAAQRLGQIVGTAAALQSEEKALMLPPSGGGGGGGEDDHNDDDDDTGAASEREDRTRPAYRQTFLTVILKDTATASTSDVLLQLLGDPAYNVDYSDGSGRGFCAASTLGRIQEQGTARAAGRVCGVAPPPRAGGDVGLEAQSLQAALLEMGFYARAVDSGTLCRSGIAHDGGYQDLENLKKQTYAAEVCNSLFASPNRGSASVVRHTPSLRTRIWGLVTGVPFQHGNGDFAASPDASIAYNDEDAAAAAADNDDDAARQLTSLETARACEEYNSSAASQLEGGGVALDAQETEKEAAGLRCLFGVPVPRPQEASTAASGNEQRNATLATRTRAIRRLTCREVLQLVQKPLPPSPTEPCRLQALDIAKASYVVGHVPIVVTDASYLAMNRDGSGADQWPAMRHWQTGDGVFKKFNELLDMGSGSSVLADHKADIEAVAGARQKAAELGLGGDVVHVAPAEALETPPAFDDGAVKTGTAKQFFNPAANAKLLGGEAAQSDESERRAAGSGKGNHTWHRAASSIAGLDLTPGFRILNEEFESAPRDSTAEEMWLSFDTFIEQVERNASDARKTQIFFPVPDSVLPDVSPADWLFFGDKDLELARRYLWISRAGVTTHLHADHDHNLFAQIRGRKRFRLFPPENWRSMHLFPRTHPLWHKSRILDLDSLAPAAQFPDFAHAHAIEAVVVPGELLYVPPYTFHQVDTLSDDSADGALGGGVAISMTSWSHNTTLYGFLDELYGMPLVTDNIGAWEGKVYAMRALVDLLISRLHGPNRSPVYARQLLDRVLSYPVGRHYPRNPAVERLCASRQLPMSRAVYQDARLDVKVLSHQLNIATPLAMRDLLAADFIEENIVHTLGVDSLRSFLGSCFRGQTYFLTRAEGDTAEQHARLWKFRTEEDEAGYSH